MQNMLACIIDVGHPKMHSPKYQLITAALRLGTLESVVRARLTQNAEMAL